MIVAAWFLVSLAVQVPADSAVLYVSNRPVIVFHAPLGALSVWDRSEAAGRRIRAALEAGFDGVSFDTVPEGRVIRLDGHPLFTVTPGDIEHAVGVTLDDEVRGVVARLEVGLREERESRSLGVLLSALGHSLVALLVLALGLRVLARVRRWTEGRLAGARWRPVRDLTLGGYTLVRRAQVLRVLERTVTGLVWAAGLFLTYIAVAYVLTRFPQTRQWGEALGEYLIDTLAGLAGQVILAVPNLFTIAVVLVAARFVSRLLSGFFRAVGDGTVRVPGLHPDTASATRRIAVAVLWLFTLAIVYPLVPGSETVAFRGVSVFAGVLVTLGSTGVIGQAMSGLVVMYTRALRPGDYVAIADTEGLVTSVGLLSTKIQTPKLVEVTIPSAVLLSQNVRNLSRLRGESGVILHTTVTIGYDAPWRQVYALLQQAAQRTPGLAAAPAPFVRQRALSDFYVEYELNAYTPEPERRLELLSRLHEQIQDLFNQYGVQIMSPHYESDKDRPVVVPPDRWAPPPVGPVAAPGA